MYILVKENNVISEISETLNRQEGTNHYLINNDTLAIPEQFIKSVYEVNDVPSNVEPEKYCYTKKDGFYKNENYVHYYTEEERISALEDMMNEIILGGM